jgi:hypothetical protein
MIRFENDNLGYLAWTERHSEGFVLNVRRVSDRNYVVLHRRVAGAFTARVQNSHRPMFIFVPDIRDGSAIGEQSNRLPLLKEVESYDRETIFQISRNIRHAALTTRSNRPAHRRIFGSPWHR